MSEHYAVDVTVSDHDSLRQGITERPWCPGGATWHRILISADEAANDQDARLLAAQMASATGRMCTSAVLVSWPTEEGVEPCPSATATASP